MTQTYLYRGDSIIEAASRPQFIAKTESIFAQGNGYLGLRCTTEEERAGERRGLFAAGSFHRLPDGISELPNLPDPTGMTVLIDGEPLTDTGTVDYSRELNLLDGTVVRRFTARIGGKQIKAVYTRFIPLTERNLICQRIELTPLDGSCKAELISDINGRQTNAGAQHFGDGRCRLAGAQCITYTAEAIPKTPAMTVSAAALHLLPNGFSCSPFTARRRIGLRCSGTLSAGETTIIEKYSAITVTDSPDNPPTDALIERAERAKKTGFDAIHLAHRRAWSDYWAACGVGIETEDVFAKTAMRFAQYHLRAMIDAGNSNCGIGAKGLTGEGYRGHSFWDTEIFLFPYYLHTMPDAARALLAYRAAGLEAAKAKAASRGFAGAMYPWEAARPEEGEVCPDYADFDIVTGEPMPVLTGRDEHHITADVAWAVVRYAEAIGDDDFMTQSGYEMLIETARFWASRAEYIPERNRYEICGVIGPDEYKEDVDNNAYTNHMAAFNLRAGIAAIDRLTGDPGLTDVRDRLEESLSLNEIRTTLHEVLTHLYLPMPGDGGLIPQTDSYLDLPPLDLDKYRRIGDVGSIYRDFNNAQLANYRVSKQADTVMLLALMPSLTDVETARRNLRFYEAYTLHDSSLSRATHAQLAARLGLDDMAASLFLGAMQTDLGERPHSSDEGIHAASLGGLWQCAVFGFAGASIDTGRLTFSPHLPAAWHALAFPFVWQGERLRVTVTHDKVEVLSEAGEDVTKNYVEEETV
ncbi:MAG: glycoside hydrolase family 65 protein [Clostridia bacterium]|nr:glycoside hydrolase family 65 protein [Clostridia bacterium]